MLKKNNYSAIRKSHLIEKKNKKIKIKNKTKKKTKKKKESPHRKKTPLIENLIFVLASIVFDFYSINS